MVYMLTASYILYYYEDILGVSAVFTGILLLAARVFDAANDPVMGILVASVFLLFLPGFFIFGANGLLTILTTVFLANSVDYGQWKNGTGDESVIFSMRTFVVKLASGVAALLASICLAVFQISENTEAEAVAAVFFGKKFKLTDEKMAEIGEELGKDFQVK